MWEGLIKLEVDLHWVMMKVYAESWNNSPAKMLQLH